MNNFTTQPKFHNLLYKSYIGAKGLDYYTAEERCDTNEHKLILIYTYGAILRCEIATDYLIEGLSMLKSSKHYRFAIKEAAKKTREQYDKYALIIKEICTDESLLDPLDHYKEVYLSKIKRHLDVMYYAILQALDDQHVAESRTLATLLMADTLISFAEGRMHADQSNSIQGLALRQLEYLSLAKVQRTLGELTSRIADLHRGPININTDRTTTALHVLGEALRDYNHILKTIEAHHD
jgi:hypothetical protein